MPGKKTSAPASVLRPLSLQVEEPQAHHFHWVLSEGAAGEQREIDRAKKAAKTYREALDAGVAALQALADDLDIGPRSEAGADTQPHGAGKKADKTEDAEDTGQAAPAPPPKRGMFGFGPVK